MLLGVNDNNEIIAVGEIPDGLVIIEVNDDIFIDKEPTQYKIQAGDNWQEITPKNITQGL